jgi:wobble nucleotide-excising tRNase
MNRMIKKIKKIKDYRIFKDFSWSSELNDFARFNLIYGWNASGKTTLSNIFREMEKRTPHHEGEIELTIDNNQVKGDQFDKSIYIPSIRVFNRDFISENVFAKGDNLAPIFYLGEKNIEKQNQIEKLQEEKQKKQDALKKTTASRKSRESELDRFCTDKANDVIKPLLRSSGTDNPYNNYNKTIFKTKCEKMLPLLEDELKSKVLSEEDRAIQLKQTKSAEMLLVNEITWEFPNLTSLSSQVSAVLKQTIVSKTIEALKDDVDLSDWSKTGLELHKDRSAEICLFCGLKLPEGRIVELEEHFNNQYEAFVKSIDDLRQTISDEVSQLQSFKLIDKANLYTELRDDYQTSANLFKSEVKEIAKYLNTLDSHLKIKKNNPFKVLQINDPIYNVKSEILSDINSLIKAHNDKTNDYEKTIINSRLKIEESLVAESLSSYIKKKDSIEKLQTKESNLSGQINGITGKLSKLESEIVEHFGAATELNEEIASYLGNSEITFKVKETGYQIYRNDRLAKNLSEGERTAIAFLYFLKTLKDKSFKIENSVVVVDDPVSSLDTNSLYHAFGYMKSKTKDAKQLFLLTHNHCFFRQVKNWFNHQPDQNKKDPKRRPCQFYMLTCSPDETSRRVAKIKHLDKLLHQYESDYHYLFKLVYQTVHSTNNSSLEEYYHMPNVARRLLEAFLAFKYPDNTGELYKVIELVEYDEPVKTRILRFLHTHSHNNMIDDPEHDESILTETKSVLNDMLELMRTKDNEHVESMEKLILETN